MFCQTLKKGDLVEISAPSSFIDDSKAFLDGIKIIKSWGLQVKENNILERKYNSFAGNDQIRFQEIEKCQESDLIIFAKGGWGSARLLESNPSWGNGLMLGFSDTSSLLLSKYAKGNLGSIHGPMIMNLHKEPLWSIQRLKDLLFKGYVEDIKGNPLKKGIARGKIIVSNLTIFTFLIGTEHMPNLKGKILIFEDINEDLYKIDRMLTYLKLSKILDEIIGIGFGNFFGEEVDLSLESEFQTLIYERLKNYNVPIISNLPIGHIAGNACIPIGCDALINGDDGTLSVNLNL
tara:strand:+ start:318 stop:1190 length:873 start_codon:yes stop_codon:yes gene_type:complete